MLPRHCQPIKKTSKQKVFNKSLKKLTRAKMQTRTLSVIKPSKNMFNGVNNNGTIWYLINSEESWDKKSRHKKHVYFKMYCYLLNVSVKSYQKSGVITFLFKIPHDVTYIKKGAEQPAPHKPHEIFGLKTPVYRFKTI